jgi:hypothetical protein
MKILDPQRIEDLIAAGTSIAKTARLVGIHHTTLLYREENDPVIRLAIGRGRQRFADALRAAAESYNAPPDTTSPELLLYDILKDVQNIRKELTA